MQDGSFHVHLRLTHTVAAQHKIVARDYPESFSPDVQAAREDTCHRDAIVRGFWVCLG
jgi:hypothetical protein